MEYLEARNAQHNERTNRAQQWQQVCKQQISIMESPIDQNSTQRQNKTINQEYTPVRERILGKIPV
jgi:hypothetical protein